MQEQELFEQYELRGWQISPRFYKILGASALINVVAFFLMAQSNFLTGKTCDSPIASGVCSVLDALYVGSVVANSDIQYVDDNYLKTELEDADISYVDVSNWKPLEYPEGYFAVANPEQQQAQIINDPNGMFPQTNGQVTPINPTGDPTDLTKVKPITPTPNNNPVIGGVPKSTYNYNPTINPTIRQKKWKPTTTKKNDPMSNTSPGILPPDGTVAENNANKVEEKSVESEPVEEVKINKKVMQDFGNEVYKLVKDTKLDTNQPFKVVVEGVITKDGKFDRTIDKKTNKAKSGITLAEGDPQMVEVGKQALEAIGDSGWLGYLRNFGADNVKITLIQDGEKLYARVESDQKTPEKARTMASGVNAIMSLTKNNVKLGEDETIILNGAQKPTSDGKFFILEFQLPQPTVQEMIQRNIKKAAEANQNSTAQTENTGQKTSK